MIVTREAAVRPAWPFRLPGASPDGVLRRRGQVIERLLHVDGSPVVVQAWQPRRDLVCFRARAGAGRQAREAIAQMRFALSVDDDLSGFCRTFRDDPLIGASVRRRPWLRLTRRPEPYETLAWAITEQLIEYRRAVGIQRRILSAFGRRGGADGLVDLPDAGTIAGAAPARLEAAGLSASRSITLRRASRLVAAGRLDLRSPDHDTTCRRLMTVPGIGRWTADVFAVAGQGRYDALPAGDLGYLKWCGRLLRGRPGAIADEEEVRELFSAYGRWAALAGAHALGVTAPAAARPRRAGTRSSARSAGYSPA